jgi:hypothetical protein
LLTQLHDLLSGGGMSRWTDRTRGDARTLELLADCAPMNAQLGSDLVEDPTLGVQVGRMLNVHRAAVNKSRPYRLTALANFALLGRAITPLRFVA